MNVGRSARAPKPMTEAEKKQALTKAKQQGQVATEQRQFAGGNKSSSGHGPMGTSAGAAARRIADETEVFKTQRAGLTLGKAIMQARTDKKLNQKDLGTKINETARVVQDYESGKAVPNPQIISKLERALGVKLPRPPKVPKKKSDD